MSQDNEWLKIVASTCLGLIAGLIAEPLKTGMTSIRTRREISNAIKVDLKFIRALLPALRLNTYSAKNVIRLIELTAFKHYWTTSKGAFYRSFQLRVLRIHCESILSDRDQMLNGLCTKLDGLKSIEENINSALKSREKNLYEKARLWLYIRKRKEQKVKFTDNDGHLIPEGEGDGKNPSDIP